LTSGSVKRLWPFALTLLLSASPAFADEQAPPQSPLSPSPQDDNATRVRKQCIFLAVMSTDGIPDLTAAKPFSASVFHICLVHAMPADWPDAQAVLKRGRQEYQDALKLNPKLFDPESATSAFDLIRNEKPKQ
jgi:hypothetical protein